jgi:hypothetical protein
MLERDGRSRAAIQQKSFDAPDDVRRFPKGTVDLMHKPVGSRTGQKRGPSPKLEERPVRTASGSG